MIYISLRFDDGTISQYSQAFKYMQKYQMPGSIYLIGKHTHQERHKKSASPQFISVEQALKMQQSGWEIGYHSWSHSYDWINQADYERELDKTLLEKRGFNISTFALPYSVYNERVLSLLQEEYSGIVGIPANLRFNSMQEIPKNKLFYCYTITNQTTLANINEAINLAIQKKKYLILLFHKIEHHQEPQGTWSFSVNLFQKLIEILNCLQILGLVRIITINDVINNLNNQ